MVDRAAKAAGGSINDAYLAALCGALRLYHDAFGLPVATLPMAVPVSLRSDADPAGGNRFVGVNLAAPIGVVDPRERISKVRAQMTHKREERALDMVGAIAPVASLLPDTVLEAMAGSVVNSDVQASNVPVYAGDTYIAGAKVLRQYGIGPLPGVATRWESSPDGLSWTFHLRRDARWSNGDAVTARDFLFSFRRALTPSLAAPKAQLFFAVKNAAAYCRGAVTDFKAAGKLIHFARQCAKVVLGLWGAVAWLAGKLNRAKWFQRAAPFTR